MVNVEAEDHSRMDNVRGSGDHETTPNGAVDVCEDEDACSICLEDFSQYQPLTVSLLFNY